MILNRKVQSAKNLNAMLYALCPMPYALCAMHYAIMKRKAFLLFGILSLPF